MSWSGVERYWHLLPISHPSLWHSLQGLLTWKMEDHSSGLQQLEKAIAGHYELTAQHPPSLATFVILAPGRVTGVVKMLLNSVGGEPRLPTGGRWTLGLITLRVPSTACEACLSSPSRRQLSRASLAL